MRLSTELDRRKLQAPTEDQQMLHVLARCVVSLAVVVQRMKNDERREQTRTGSRIKREAG